MTRVSSTGRLRALIDRSGEGAIDALQKLKRLEWLGQEINRARLHHFSAHRDVAVTGDENQLLFPASLDQGLLKLKAIQVGHLDVDNDASGPGMTRSHKEIGRGLENLSLVISGA